MLWFCAHSMKGTVCAHHRGGGETHFCWSEHASGNDRPSVFERYYCLSSPPLTLCLLRLRDSQINDESVLQTRGFVLVHGFVCILLIGASSRMSRGSGPSFLSTKNPLQLHINGGQRHCQETKLAQTCSLFFSSSPKFSDTDLAQAIYMASSVSPKLFLALLVTSFIVSLYTHIARTCIYTSALRGPGFWSKPGPASSPRAGPGRAST